MLAFSDIQAGISTGSLCCEAGTSEVVEVTKENFHQIFSSSQSIVLMIYADWCGCCCRFQPVLEDFKEKFEKKLVFAKMNYDRETYLADSFNLNYVPTFIFIDQGQIIYQTDEIDTDEELETAIVAWLQQSNS
jgi:thioredoxin-like negative regulator of GroEL